MSYIESQANELLTKNGFNKAELATKFSSYYQIEALEQVLKNKQDPETALNFNVKTSFTYGGDTPQFKALKTGLTVEQSLKFTSDYQVSALRLGLTQEQALKFSSYYQIEALEQVLKNKQDPETALSFNVKTSLTYGGDTPQFEVLKTGLTVEQSLKFTYGSQVSALKFGLTQEQALKFISDFQVSALRLGLTQEQALKFSSYYQIEALEQVLKNKQDPETALSFNVKTYEYGYTPQFEALKTGLTVEQSLKFTSHYQVSALKLGLTQELSLKFSSYYQIEALEQVLKNKQDPETALSFNVKTYEYSYTPQFEALKTGLTVEQSLKFTSREQLDTLKEHVKAGQSAQNAFKLMFGEDKQEAQQVELQKVNVETTTIKAEDNNSVKTTSVQEEDSNSKSELKPGEKEQVTNDTNEQASCAPQLESKPLNFKYSIESLTPAGNSKVDKSAQEVKAMTDQTGNLWFTKSLLAWHPWSIETAAVQLISNKIIKHYLGEHAAHNQLYTDANNSRWLLSKEIPNFKTLTHMGNSCDNKPIVGYEFLAMLKALVSNSNNEPNNYGVVVYEDKCVATQIDGDEAFQNAPYKMKINFKDDYFIFRDKDMFRCGGYSHDCSDDVRTLKGDDRENFADMLKAIDTIAATDKSVFKDIVHDVIEELKVHYNQAQFDEYYRHEKVASFEELENIYNSFIEANLVKMNTLVHDTVVAAQASEAV